MMWMNHPTQSSNLQMTPKENLKLRVANTQLLRLSSLKSTRDSLKLGVMHGAYAHQNSKNLRCYKKLHLYSKSLLRRERPQLVAFLSAKEETKCCRMRSQLSRGALSRAVSR